MKHSLIALSRDALFSLRDLLPIILVIGIFQLFVIKQPVSGFFSLLFGAILVVVGLAFFIFGLRVALFPIGEGLAHSLAKKGSVFWLFTFAFVLGFGTTLFYLVGNVYGFDLIKGSGDEVNWYDVKSISAGVFGIPVAFVVTFVVSRLTPQPSQEMQQFIRRLRVPRGGQLLEQAH